MSRRSGSSAAAAVEVVLLPSLRNCLVNLPASLVALLSSSSAPVQNVVVELQFRNAPPPGSRPTSSGGQPLMQSVFFGWTGMQSQSKIAPIVGRDGIRGSGSGRQDEHVASVEIDATFARRVGLSEGMKASILLHVDPPLAHTVNIEPVTAIDWEIIGLHSSFLETNFLSQVRALPNPAGGHPHPLTLHLTPTSTANIIITSLTPAAPSSQAFVKIAGDAEVIVAPKTRQLQRPSSSRDNRSTGSVGRKSASGRSERGAVKHRGTHESEKARPPIFLRAVTRALKNEWFENEDDDMKDDGLRIWLDLDHIQSKTLRGVTWVTVQYIKPAGLQEPVDPQSTPTPEHQPAAKVVARLCTWEDAPDSRHVALSSLLCATLGVEGVVGGIVRIDPAPTPLPKTASALKEPSQQASKDAIVKRLRITPFIPAASDKKNVRGGFKFGGETKSEREEATQRIKTLFGKSMLEGPLTDSMLLPAQDGWPGGILDFDPSPPGDPGKARINWLIGGERKLDVSIQPETARQTGPKWLPGEPLPEQIPELVAIESVLNTVRNSLLHTSSVLLTGGLGSGKTSAAQLLAHELRRDYLFHVTYVPCRTLVSDDTRVKTVKDTLHRVFACAAWGARQGGRALVVLDDLDRVCPVETELQVDANGRSRQLAELLCSTVRAWCSRDSGVVMLATAQGKEGVNSVVIGGHVVRDIVAIKAPSKDGRRKVLEKLIREAQKAGKAVSVDKNGHAADEWMDASTGSRPSSVDGFAEESEELDFLEIAGQTDGYMPGDLAQLVSRARSEALIRALSDDSLTDDISLTSDDFTAALKGFTPASLRGVTLHSSTTTFAAIGGLKKTRQTLLETLQYPTTYAPLFAKCPLRLRSGLLLYGYPGCGKTLLASAVAGECGLNFISVKGPEILNKYIGASEKSVRDLFERAEAAKPCVLFFDEFDAIAPKRGHDSTGVTDRVVNMLLTMMDGAEGLSGVYVLAATSRPDLIDPALLRPGRLDKSLICDMPNEEDRMDILRAVSDKLKLDPSVLRNAGPQSVAEVARRTDGYSGADLQAIMYNAHLDAIHDVLGSTGADSASQELGKRKNDARRGSSQGKQIPDFVHFRMQQTSTVNANASAAVAAAERAQITAKLAALKLSKQKAKAQRHAEQGRPLTAPATMMQRPSSAPGQRPLGAAAPQSTGGAETEAHTAEPVINWRHLAKSLDSTRSSISAQERRRLAGIYREFVVGRNGDMQDGQGGTEIGGRTSLA